jgi:N-acetylglutamate synthase/N-acetylornithine aminotransferase
MKWGRMLAVVGLAGVLTSGCVAVSAKNNRYSSDLDAVVVNNRVAIVNTCTGEMAWLDSTDVVSLSELHDPDHCHDHDHDHVDHDD